MTKIVYADPNISPKVWTPPAGVIVRPLHEHPAIVADRTPMQPRPLPPADEPIRRGRPVNAELKQVVDFLRMHGPATVPTIAQATGGDMQRISNVIRTRRKLFRRVAQVGNDKGTGRPLVVWGLTEL